MTILDVVRYHPLLTVCAAITIPVWVKNWLRLVSIGHKLAKLAGELVFPKQNLMDSTTSGLLVEYLRTKGRALGYKEDLWDARSVWIRDEGRPRTIFFRKPIYSHTVFLYKGAVLILAPPTLNKESDKVSKYGNIRYLRGTVNWKKLLIDAQKWSSDKDDSHHVSRFQIFQLSGGGGRGAGDVKVNKSVKDMQGVYDGDHSDEPVGFHSEEIGWARSERDLMSALALSPTMRELIRDAKFWSSHQEWYKKRRIAWRRGYLLYGKPGTGKTSIVRALAEQLDVPIYIFDISSMNNQELFEAWNSAKDQGARIMLFEDIDTVFHGRTNVLPHSTLDFGVLLNLLDGIKQNDGVMFIATSNHPEHIDVALGAVKEGGKSTRPGRIDRTFELPDLSEEGRFKIAKRILLDEEWAARVASEAVGECGAEFQDRCICEALIDLWGKEATAVEEDGS